MLPLVLALTARDDDDLCALLDDALQQRGARLLRLSTETLPSERQLDAVLTDDGWRGSITTDGGRTVDLDRLHSVWLRQLNVGADLPREGLHPSVRGACRRETYAAVEGLVASLPRLVVNDPFAQQRAESKVFQLLAARRAGLTTPDTVVGNRPAALRDFAATHQTLVTKMLATVEVQARSAPSGKRSRVMTSAVGPEDLDALEEGLTLSTTLLQERLPKQVEVRATVVGERIFASAVDSQVLPGAEVDWRAESGALMDAFRPIDVPGPVRRSLLQLHRDLELTYGGADFVVTPEGRWVFLETNPSGDWGWIHRSGHDVAGAMADLLLRGRT